MLNTKLIKMLGGLSTPVKDRFVKGRFTITHQRFMTTRTLEFDNECFYNELFAAILRYRRNDELFPIHVKALTVIYYFLFDIQHLNNKLGV